MNSTNALFLEWGCNILVSIKGEYHNERYCLTFDGHLFCYEWICKAGMKKNKEDDKLEGDASEKNHACSCMSMHYDVDLNDMQLFSRWHVLLVANKVNYQKVLRVI